MGASMMGDATPPNRAEVSEPARLFPTPGAPVAVAVGVDLLQHGRLLATYRRHGERFLRRVFTAEELAVAGGRVERLAGRFVAKEACAKALGTGIGQVSWQEIEVVRLPGGKPALRLRGRALARAAALGLTAFDVSISDSHEYTIAVVVGVRG
jgi:holo-[acyl-carrier protein] synthase